MSRSSRGVLGRGERDLLGRETNASSNSTKNEASQRTQPTPNISSRGFPNSRFQYNPLDRSKSNSLRLLTILPAPRGSVPMCTLSEDTWGQDGSNYDALSYVWGDTTAVIGIKVDGEWFPVTPNLYSALQHLQLEGQERKLWIDAICIQQSNILERNHQVAAMGKIYQNCSRVLIWLGEADKETQLAFSFIQRICSDFEEKNIKWRSKEDIKRIWSERSDFGAIGPYITSEFSQNWSAVFQLLRREWWARAWVFQEFINAPHATFYVGNHSLDWPGLYLVINILYGIITSAHEKPPFLDIQIPDYFALIAVTEMAYFRPPGASNSKEGPAVQRHSEVGQFLQSNAPFKTPLDSPDPTTPSYFMYLLQCQRRRQCIDPRDKVYSILSMATPSLQTALYPDYSRPTRWTYVMAVKSFIDIYGSLEILTCSTYSASVSAYPSWCPDWEATQTRSVLGATFFVASGNEPAEATFSSDLGTIHMRGFRIDTIGEAHIQDTDQAFSWEMNGARARCNWDLQRIADKLASPSCRSHDDIDANYNYELLSDDHPHQDLGPETVRRLIIFRALLRTLVAEYKATSAGASEGRIEFLIDPERDESTGEYWPPNLAEYFGQAYQRIWGRTVIISSMGRLGLVPLESLAGDEIFILCGCSTPVILRKREDGAYTWIGDAYIQGLMRGEAMKGIAKKSDHWESVSLR